MRALHDHGHTHPDYSKQFGIGIAINVGYIVVEVIFGLMVGSMALLADAGHNAGDVLSLGLAWGASLLGRSEPTRHRTYGLRRSSILASLANAVILLLAIGAIAWEAIRRLAHPEPVSAGTMMWVAAIGVGINAATALLFVGGRKTDLNLRAAFLHMAGDAATSAGVILAGLAIQLTGLSWIDPATSLAIVLLIGLATWGLLRDSFNLAVDAVPKGIDPDKVERYLSELPGVTAVHDLHIWGMSTTQSALTVHLVKPDGVIDDALLSRICGELHTRFGIEHVTVQLETNAETQCRQAQPGSL